VTTAEADPDSKQDSNATDSNGLTDEIVIGASNWVDHSIDLGLQGKGKIGDYVWFDTNDNGIQDAEEKGIGQIEVKLYKENGSGGRDLVEEQKTNGEGLYLFEHLVEGDYYVWFQTPSIYKLAKSEAAGSTTGDDSNKIHETGDDQGFTVNKITIGGSQPWEDLTIDLGFTGKGAIGNYVWHDRNRNGIQDEGSEHGINGVTVSLYKDSTTGTPYRTDTTKTEDGKPGYYSFTELPEGTYYVKFDYPDQYEKTVTESNSNAENGSNEINDSNTTGAIEIAEDASPFGWVNPSIDLGLVAQGSIGNYVWLDRNRNGIQDEAAAEGLNGIAVRLYKDSTSGTAYAETVTANGPDGKSGYYLFDNLASGDYYLQIVLDESHEVTLANQGSGDQKDELDSNSINAQGFTSVIPISENGPKGWNDLTIDFGLVRKGSIGDYVWLDKNANGKQDDNDVAGLNGVTVRLYDASKAFIAETKTAVKDGKPGYYLFDHLVKGDYYVRFTTPDGYILTKAGASSVQPDVDSNPIFNGYTEIIPIGPGTTWSNLTIDQGLYLIPYIPGPEPTPTPTPGPEESVPPGETEEPGTSPTPTPTPTPGATVKPTPTPVTEKTTEETPVKGEVEVPKGSEPKIGTPPANGDVTLTPDGKWVYTPDPDYVGKDRFSVIIINENNEEEEIWFEIDVEPIPEGTVDATPDVENLPKTGQTDYTLLYLIGAAFVGGGILLRLYGRRRTQ
jgi:LPXTG-motif cell wall-anchored protein